MIENRCAGIRALLRLSTLLFLALGIVGCPSTSTGVPGADNGDTGCGARTVSSIPDPGFASYRAVTEIAVTGSAQGLVSMFDATYGWRRCSTEVDARIIWDVGDDGAIMA